MDPLTISTGIITLLQATTAIITTCYDFRAALKKAPWSLTKIVEELKSLRSILEGLDELALDWEKPARFGMRPALEMCMNPDNGPLVICLREVTNLGQKLKFSSYAGITGRRRMAAIQALGWQLTEKDAKGCLERIDRCKNTLSLALAGDTTKLLSNIQQLTSSVQATALDIDIKLMVMADDLRNSHLDCEHAAMIKWLSKADPYENHESANSIHLKGTSEWIFDCKHWQAWAQASSSFLWLSGFRMHLSPLYLEILELIVQFPISWCWEDHPFRHDNPNDIGVAYFYCDFRRKEFQCAKTVVGSIVAQLCSQFPYPNGLMVAYQNSKIPGQNQHPSWEVLEETLSWLSKDHRMFVMIDAVDECEQGKDIVAFFTKFQEHMTQLSVLLTSRDEIVAELECQSWSRLPMETRRVEVDVDIKLYIEKRLEVDDGLRMLSLLVKTEIRNSLHQKCAGMFRWAQCQLDDIARMRTVRSIRSSLAKLPKGLDETYERILKRTPQEDVELLRKILLWVSFTAMPLKIEELHEAIALDVDADTIEEVEECRLNDPKDIFSLGGSLITVSEGGEIRLAHLSVKDYLLSIDLRGDVKVSTFGMRPKQANEELARYCLAYLLLDSLTWGPALTIEKWEARLTRHPLLRHVAKAWTYYFRAADSTPDLNGLVTEFFSPRSRNAFMSWIQVLNSNWIYSFDKYPKHATSLYYAASFGLAEVTQGLIQSGVDLNAPGSRFGGTALHGATLREHVGIMKVLLEAGANPSQADFNLIAPLHTAARVGNLQVLKLLLDHGASRQAVDSLGETPYDWAVKAGQVGAQKLLKGEECELVCREMAAQKHVVYQRPIAHFPSLMAAQGLAAPGLENSVIYQPRSSRGHA
ncbi:hypothetical protein F5Y09DRAFT_352082 [Xylaria sp. FL1042]|nr:hypothetical protein F5Y09DRAFT_352082 [Xylaria sp. FL1042]